MTGTQRGDTARKHAAWLRECARRADALAAEYRANADRIEARAAELERDPLVHPQAGDAIRLGRFASPEAES